MYHLILGYLLPILFMCMPHLHDRFCPITILSLEILFKSATPTLTVSVTRPRNESKEEKRARKQAIKEERKVRAAPSLAMLSCDCCCCPVFIGEESREEGDQASLQERGTQARENFSWLATNCSCCLIILSPHTFQIPSPVSLLFLCESSCV